MISPIVVSAHDLVFAAQIGNGPSSFYSSLYSATTPSNYRRENGRLRRVGEVTLTRGEILPMLAETVHVAECLGGKPTIGLHVYGGDIMGEVPRHMWDPQTLAEHALDWNTYETFAQAASQAPSAP